MRSLHWRSRYSLDSDRSLNSPMAARFTCPRRSIFPLVSWRSASQVSAVASGASPSRSARNSNEVAASCSAMLSAPHAHLLGGERIVQRAACRLDALVESGLLARARATAHRDPRSRRARVQRSSTCVRAWRARSSSASSAASETSSAVSWRSSSSRALHQVRLLLVEARASVVSSAACEVRRD